MSVIQNIRDKYARVAVIAIALALLGFILMDAFTGRSNLFGGNNTTVGSVNGNKIEYVAFSRKVKAQEDMAQQQGYEINDATRQQIIESAWNEEINRTLLQREFEELGLTVGKKEMNDLLFGANPPADLKQGFTDPQTGAYNALGAQQYFNELKKNGTAEQKAQMGQYLESLEYQQMVGKYTSLLSNSIYYAKWFLEKQNTDNSLIARISYVAVPYATISDSVVKVTDSEIKDYIEDHKNEFEQKEETRSISYVTFSAAPTAADSVAVRNSMNGLKAEFDAAQDYEAFALTQSSPMGFYDGHISAENIKIPNKDSVLNAPVGAVYGPYVDGSSYVLSKILSVKQWPDTVNVRHILIATQQQGQGGQSMRIREDSTARRLADSLQTAIRNGASFDSLVVQFSDDPGSKEKGGVYENIPTGQMVAPFNEFIFGNPTGSKGVVKTNYGFHYVEIMSQKGSSPAYKIAYVSKPIAASQETDATASNQANLFAGNSRDLKSFNDNYDKTLKNQGTDHR
jgi:peptidyl-prolyl cis-trans isomerase D